MKKKACAVVLTAIMATSVFGNTAMVSAEDQEITEIVWQWPSLGSAGSGLYDVENALNEMLEPAIGVHVTLEPVSAFDLLNETTLAVTSGEQLDLSLQLATGLSSYVSAGLIQPLDDYIEEYGPDIIEKCGDGLKGGYYQDHLYGILSTAYVTSDAYGFAARKDILDKYNITIEDGKTYTLDELEDIFATVKEGEGDKFYMIQPYSNEMPLNGAALELDPLGSTPASGVLMLNRSFDDLTISNLYDTDEYEEYANRMYDWAQKGYYSKDAATDTESSGTLPSNYLGMFAQATPARLVEITSQNGYEFEMIPIVSQYVKAQTATVSWQVPITSASPEKAIETLNYIFGHTEAATLLLYGIEGVDYEVVDSNDDGTVIRYLADDASTLSYYQPFTVYGDRLSWPVVEPAPITMNKDMRDWDAQCSPERVSPANGYIFDLDAVSDQYSAVVTVLDQYRSIIDMGAMDPAESLPEFRSALKAAGIDEVIAENQRQLDEWAAKQGK